MLALKPVSPWNDEKLDRLKTMWTDGVTQADIASALKVSRSTIAGKVFRLVEIGELARRTEYRPKPPKPVPAAKATRFNPAFMEKSPPTLPEETETLDPHLVDGKPVTMRNCNDRTCKWIIGDAAADAPMCGRPVRTGSPYCSHHSVIAFQPQHNQESRQRQAEKTAVSAA